MGNVFLCRPATPASVSQDSSSVRCRPTALVSNDGRKREMEWDRGILKGAHKHTHASADTRGPSASVYHHLCKQVLNTKHYTAQKPWEMERAKMKGIRLFMLTCSVMPDNSVQAIQRAATVLWSLTSLWRPWPRLCSASAGLRPITVECLSSRGAPKSALGKWSSLCWWNATAKKHHIQSLLLSFSVPHCRCEWVRRGPMWREGPLYKQLWLLHLSVPQRLQPGDHPEQEVLSRWGTAQMTAGDIMFPVDESHHRLLLALWLSVRVPQVLVCQHCSFKKHPALINAVKHNSHFLFRSLWFSFKLADINECSMPNKCQYGKCVNTEGSYTCECNGGYAKSWRGLCEGDMHARALART